MNEHKSNENKSSKKLFKLRFTNELYPYYRTINYLLHLLFYQMRTDTTCQIDKILKLYEENSEIFINNLEEYNTMVSKNNLPLLSFNNNDIPIFVIELKELQYASKIFLENPENIISKIWSNNNGLSKHLLEKLEIIKLQNHLSLDNSNIFIYFYNQLDSGNKNLLYWFFNKYYSEKNY